MLLYTCANMNFKLVLLWCLALAVLVVPALAQATRPVVPSRGAMVAVIEVEGTISDYTRRDLERGMAKARAAGATAIILEIDTYGGLVISGLDMSRLIKQADIPCTAFVRTKAISAGSMIALACNDLYMAPASSIGDCAPIIPGMELGDTERAKAESPILSDFRESARRNGYDPLLLEAMVSIRQEVYWIQNASGLRRFVTGDTYANLMKEGGWTPVLPDRNPLNGKGNLLTLDYEDAQRAGLSRGTVASADELVRQRGWQVVLRQQRGAGDRLIAFLSSGPVTFILITILSMAIYAALHAPGHGMAEVVIVTCLAVLLGVPLLTGCAEWWEVLCVLIGLVLLALEIFVIPGFGVTGVAGILLVVFGLVMTLVPPVLPNMPGVAPRLQLQWELVSRALVLVLGAMFTSLVGAFFISRYLPSLPIGRRLVLTATSGKALGGSAEVPPVGEGDGWIKLGDQGLATTDLRPGGKAAFRDPVLNDPRPVDVLCDEGFVPAGTRVVVHEFRGQVIVVRKVGV